MSASERSRWTQRFRPITIAPDSTIIATGPGGALALRVDATFFEPVPAPRERRTKAVDAKAREFPVAGPADQAYLASVSAGEPLEEDLEQYTELMRRLSPVIDEDELRSGYDHFGRLVLSGTTARYSGTTQTLFAVRWPFLRMEYRPLWSGRDEDLDGSAVIRGEASPPPGGTGQSTFSFPTGASICFPRKSPSGISVGVTKAPSLGICKSQSAGRRDFSEEDTGKHTPYSTSGSKRYFKGTVSITP